MADTTATLTRRDEHVSAAVDAGLATAHWRALGTSVQVVVTRPERLDDACGVVIRVLDDVDATASRFRPDSELARLNVAAGGWTVVSPLLARMLRAALDAAVATDGLVDPTVGAAMVGLGYDRTFRLVPRDLPEARVSAQCVPGWQHVELDDDERAVRLPGGVLLDLGATAKGLAADVAADAAVRAAGCGVLVNLGGDLAVAGSPPADGWPVAVGDVADPDLVADGGPIQVVAIHAGAIATSSTTARRWRRGGSPLHHIVDPRTGMSAPGPWRTVSVAAATCLEANVASTAAIVLGHRATWWLTARDVPARLVTAHGDVVHLDGWPEAGEQQ